MKDKSNYNKDELRRMIESLPDVSTRPMFGYQCYSVGGKFFTGFGKKSNLIIRLSSDLQAKALRDKQIKIKPFSHGAKMGWVEIDEMSILDNAAVFNWIKKGYEHAQLLSKNNLSRTKPRTYPPARKKFQPRHES